MRLFLIFAVTFRLATLFLKNSLKRFLGQFFPKDRTVLDILRVANVLRLVNLLSRLSFLLQNPRSHKGFRKGL